MPDPHSPKRLIPAHGAQQASGALVPATQPPVPAAVLTRLSEDVKHYAVRIGRYTGVHPDVIEDVIQRVVLTIAQSPSRLAAYMESVVSMIKLVRTSLRNAKMDFECKLQCRERALGLFELQIPTTADGPDVLYDAKELAALLVAAIHALPTYQRLPFLMALEGGKTDDEIASALGISPRSLKNYICLAESALLEKAERAGFPVGSRTRVKPPKDVLELPRARAVNDNSHGRGNGR